MLIHFALVEGRDDQRARDGNGNIPVIWVKTDAGCAEMQTRALIKERARRNLLLLIVPFTPNLSWAIAILLVRFAFSQMDVPARQAYVVSIVPPEEELSQ